MVSHEGFDDLISKLSMRNKKENLEALYSRKKAKPQLLFQTLNNKMNSPYATCFDGLDGLVLAQLCV